MKRIFHIVPFYFPRLGGVERLVSYIVKEQVKQGYEVHIITRRLPNTPSYEKIKGIPVHRAFTIDKHFFVSSFLPIFLKIKKLVNKKEDILIAHDWSMGFSTYLSGKKYVLFIHGYGPWERKIALNALSNFVCSKAKIVFANGPFMKKYSKFNPNYITEAIDVNEFGYTPIKNTKTVLLLTRLSEEKHPDWAIKGFKKLNMKDWKMIVLGDGPQRKEMEALAKGHSITFLGFKNDIRKYIKQSTIVFAGGPTAAIEAMAMGRPTITIQERDTPVDLNCPKISKPEEFVFNFKKFNKDLKKWSKKHREDIVKNHNIEKVVRDFMKKIESSY